MATAMRANSGCAPPLWASPIVRGLALGVLASVLWGTVFVAGRYLVEIRQVPSMVVASMRFGFGAVVALGFLLATGRGAALRAAAVEWPLLGLLGAIGIFGMGSMVFLSVRYTASINASIICNANPIFIALFAPLIGERVPFLRVAGLLMGLAGCVVISLSDLVGPPAGGNDLLGCTFAVFAACFWAAYTVLGKGVSQRRGGLPAAGIALLAGGLLFIPATLLTTRIPPLGWQELLVGLYLGVGPTAVSMLAWYQALEYVEANVLGPTQYLATLVATVLGWALLGEHIGAAFVVGGTAVLVGLYLTTRPAGTQGNL